MRKVCWVAVALVAASCASGGVEADRASGVVVTLAGERLEVGDGGEVNGAYSVPIGERGFGLAGRIDRLRIEEPVDRTGEEWFEVPASFGPGSSAPVVDFAQGGCSYQITINANENGERLHMYVDCS